MRVGQVLHALDLEDQTVLHLEIEPQTDAERSVSVRERDGDLDIHVEPTMTKFRGHRFSVCLLQEPRAQSAVDSESRVEAFFRRLFDVVGDGIVS